MLVAVVGAGVAGMAMAEQLLKKGAYVRLFERSSRAGGLARFETSPFSRGVKGAAKYYLTQLDAAVRAHGERFAFVKDTEVRSGADLEGDVIVVAWGGEHGDLISTIETGAKKLHIYEFRRDQADEQKPATEMPPTREGGTYDIAAVPCQVFMPFVNSSEQRMTREIEDVFRHNIAGRNVLVVGMGNVALDVAGVLKAQDPENMLEWVAASREEFIAAHQPKRVYVVGRKPLTEATWKLSVLKRNHGRAPFSLASGPPPGCSEPLQKFYEELPVRGNTPVELIDHHVVKGVEGANTVVLEDAKTGITRELEDIGCVILCTGYAAPKSFEDPKHRPVYNVGWAATKGKGGMGQAIGMIDEIVEQVLSHQTESTILPTGWNSSCQWPSF